jgi:DNA-binding MarR family transcriptional regulator
MRSTPAPADFASQLRLAITRTARRLRQEAGSNLSPSQRAALATIERHGPLTPSDLAEREAVARPTVTRVVARLEEAGLVTRTEAPDDRRSSVVAITAAGRAQLDEDRARTDHFLARKLETLDAEDRATLERAAAVLERLLEADPARGRASKGGA